MTRDESIPSVAKDKSVLLTRDESIQPARDEPNTALDEGRIHTAFGEGRIHTTGRAKTRESRRSDKIFFGWESNPCYPRSGRCMTSNNRYTTKNSLKWQASHAIYDTLSRSSILAIRCYGESLVHSTHYFALQSIEPRMEVGQVDPWVGHRRTGSHRSDFEELTETEPTAPPRTSFA